MEESIQTFTDLEYAIASMFSTPSGKLVLEDLNSKLKEPSYILGESPEHAIYREGSRNTLAWLIETNNKVNKG